ncbi:fructosamine kinase family protein [Fundicoccus ignavus]|uniref:Phosphotransferase n=1 Tax=Fundicoccus ignavus TaxID=2664442 RepID=A0A844CDR6_9LACT|nr:fructosamine kinase family protein [Fundicoccus ignavus]MRJ48537.1 phosphotransferase [Fundicoccus ignavus]
MDAKWLGALPIDGIREIQEVRGGDVNQTYRLKGDNKDYFLLVQAQRNEAFFASEIAGLHAFEASGIRAPKVIASGTIENDAYLVLEYLEEGQGSQKELGKLVARLHKQHSANGQFGFHLPHHGAAISFDNQWTSSWSELFVERRLDGLRDALVTKGRWTPKEVKQYEAVRHHILTKLAEHKCEASLLHGDLWSGNFMFLADASPALFDPSPFYGDREFDIGITTVFGGFNQEFYDAYQAAYPLESGWQERIKYYRLYLLMVHLDKFGTTYALSVERELADILADK